MAKEDKCMKTNQENVVLNRFPIVLFACALLLQGCTNSTSKQVEEEPEYKGGGVVSDPKHVGSLREQWGVEVLGIQATATGYMLDFRYRVVDAEKAAPLLDRRIKPYILVKKDNARLEVPVTNKLGALRQTTKHVKPNRNYFVLFSNPARHVKSGDKVSVVIGDFVVDNLSVL